MSAAHTILLAVVVVVGIVSMAEQVGLAVEAHRSMAVAVLALEQLIQVVVELEFLKMLPEMVEQADLVLWY
jgi:hypothetical protein